MITSIYGMYGGSYAPDFNRFFFERCVQFCCVCFQADYCCLNDQWLLQDVAAVFSRHYLHQNRALEIFFSDRSSAFFSFESSREVRSIVRRLPKVGVGTAYDFSQTRSVQLLLCLWWRMCNMKLFCSS